MAAAIGFLYSLGFFISAILNASAEITPSEALKTHMGTKADVPEDETKMMRAA